MAIDNQFGKGIGLAAGFDLGAQKPLDARIAVNTIAERDAHVTENRAYEGMLVFVDADKKTYQLLNGAWVVFFDNDANIEGAEGQAAKDLEQDNRLQALEGKVGKAAEGDAAAEGLFLGVDEAKAAAQVAKKAADDEAARAADVEADLQSAIDAINNEENGILAQAKAHAEAQDIAQKETIDGQIAAVQGAVDTEKGRAEGVEAGLQQAIDAINNADTGVLKQAKDYADAREVQIRADIKAVTDDHETRLAAAEGDIDEAEEAIIALQEEVAAIKGGDVEVDLKAVDERISALEADKLAKDKAVEDNAAAAKKAQDEVDALELVVGVEAAEGQEASGIFKKMNEAHAAMEGQMAADKAELEGKITAEAQAREGADNAINTEIAKMKNAAEEGSLANQIADEVARADAEEKRIVELVEVEAQAARAAEEQLGKDIVAEKQRAEGQEAAIRGEVEAAINKEVEDRNAAIDAAIEEVNGAASTLEGRVKANEDAIAVINGTEEGSIKKAVADLVDGAPEALDTLNELAAALRDNADVLTAVETAFDNKLAAQKQELQKEIDDDVKVEADRAQGEEARIEGLVATEKDRAEGVEAGFEARIKVNENFVAAQPAIDEAQDNRIKALEDANKEGGAMAEAVQAAQAAADAAQDAADAAQAAADAAQADVDAVKQRLDAEGGLVDRLEAAEAFVADMEADIEDHEERVAALEAFQQDHSLAVAEMEQGIANNKAAIEKEVKDREAAIEAALEPYSTTEEVKAILGNVVATLNLSMVNDKVVLKLGGAEGIALSEVSLDLATDDDIDAIIAGLDAE